MSDYVSLPKKALAVFLNFAFLANQIYAEMPPSWRVVSPDWWNDSDVGVMSESTGRTVDYGVANIGQAKWMAYQALRALDATAPGTATAIRADLAGIVDFTVPASPTQAWRDKQNSVLLVGQLKAIAAPFYTRLNLVAPAWLDRVSASYAESGQLQKNGTKDAGAAGNYLPWTVGTSDDKNKAVATIGQLKAVFALRFEHLSNIDTDGDGMPDLWEVGNGSNPNVYDRTAIKPGTSSSFYDLYLKTQGVGSGGYASAPPAGLGTIPELTLDAEAPHTPVTSLKGSLSVGSDGAANYSIPIDIPKGTAGMEPKISLGYSSGGGNGLVGMGWSLGGLQRITRGPSSMAKDGFYDPLNFDVQANGSTKDRFFLDGERLICVDGVYGAPGSVYRTEIDSFARITAVGTGPEYWTVETKAGLVVSLGGNPASRLSAGSGNTLAWCVNKVSDTLGNYYAVTYERDDPPSNNFHFANHRVATIDYTGNANGLAPYCSIDFSYESRPDVSRAFTTYSGSYISKRLSRIRVKTKNYINHDYVLGYTTSYQSGRSLMTSIDKRINGDSSKMTQPTVFTYDGLTSSESIWSDPGITEIPTYSDNLDASGEVNSMVSAYVDNTAIKLTGDVARAYRIPDTTMYSDTKLTFDVYSSGGLDGGAFIGLDDDRVFQLTDTNAFCRIGGSGSVKMADGIDYPGSGRHEAYTSGDGWKTYTLNLGSLGVTGIKKYLILMCADNNVDDGVSSASFRNVKIYRSGTQTPTTANAVAFTVSPQLPRFSDDGGKDLGVTSLDLNSDGLPDFADWRVVDYTRNSGNDLLPQTYGDTYRNDGDRFVIDSDIRPPASLPLGSRVADGDGYEYSSKHHLLAQPVDVDGDGKLDLMGSVDLKTNTDKTYLKNEYAFYSYNGSAWVENTAWRLPFYITNTSSTNGNGGKKRDEHFQWVDLNADGYQDLVVHTTGDGRLYDKATSTLMHDPDSADSNGESFAFINKGKDGPGWINDTKRYLPVPLMEDGKDVGRRILDVDGDGIPELMQSRYESGSTLTRHNYFMLGSGSYLWSEATDLHPYDLPAALVLSNEQPAESLLVDLNGDGLVDMLRSSKNDDGFVSQAWMNRGTRAWDSEVNSGNDATAQLSSYRFPYPLHFEKTIDGVNQRVPYGFEMADINGDGLTDVLYSDEDNTETSGPDNLVFMNNGNGWQARSDFGLPSTYRIYTSESDRKDRKRRCKLQDINGDGFPDLITGILNNTPKVWFNQCRPEVMKTVTDGMGLQLEVGYKRLNDPTPVPGFNDHRVYDKGDSALPAGQARIIDARLVVSYYFEPDGKGDKRKRYQRYGDLRYDRYNEASLGFGWIEAKDGLNSQLVRTETSRTYPTGGSAINTKTWVFVDEDESAYYEPLLGPIAVGRHLVSEETATFGELASWSGPGGTIRRPVQTGSVKTLWDLAGTIVSKTTTTQNVADFDAFGFVTKSTVESLDESQVETVSTYSHQTTGGRWNLGRLTASTATKSGGGRPTLTKNSSFTYETTNGLLKTETIESGNALSSTKTYTYDTSGNITATSLAGTSVVTRSSSSTYDSRRRFVVSESNQLGHTVKYQYDQRRALLLASTDINGFTTRFEYDAFGTLILTRHPDGTKTGESTGYYTSSIPASAKLPADVITQIDPTGQESISYYRAKQTSGSPVSIIYFDALGRELANATTILRNYVDGGTSTYSKLYTVTRYDRLGRKSQVSEPFGYPYDSGYSPRFTTIKQDVINRVLKTTHPDGTFEQVLTFSTDNSNVKNPLNYSKVKTADDKELERWEDQHGRLVRSRDESELVTQFAHDQEGRVVSVTLGGNEILTNKFDTFGNKYEVWEANSGTSSSVYNAFGEVTKSKNANNKETEYFYDVLGRVERVKKPDSEGDYYNFYDQALGAGLGKFWKTTGPDSYQETIAYDSLGRPGVTTKTMVAPGQTLAETFTTTTYYDALGRVSSETDAGGLTVVHGYDTTWSFQTKLTIGSGMAGAGEVLWKAGVYDSRGRATSQFLAQNVTTSVTYNPNHGLVDALTASQGGTSLQSKSYVWDGNNKNLTSRTDVLKSRSETFGYDGLNRVTSTTYSGSGAPPVANYTYDGSAGITGSKGNLMSKPGASLTYGGTGIYRPNAVTSATIKGAARTYAYDAAGYVTDDTKRTYAWTSFGQLKELNYTAAPALQDFSGNPLQSSAQVNTKFTFDATGNRAGQLKQRFPSGGSVVLEETLYLGGYEREIHSGKTSSGATPVVTRTVHRHSIGGFAVYTRTAKPSLPVETKLTTLLKDHLGSTDLLVTGTWNGSAFASQTTEEQSFDAWGERRSPGSQNVYRAADGDAFRTSARDYDRGYTGHEQLDDSGLIHMNGRIYDPELGRMLSPDPNVQVPEYSQNFNRYSYVMNNPLNMTDPTGYSWVSKAFKSVGSWFKENWRTVVVVVAAFVLTIATAGIGYGVAYGVAYSMAASGAAFATAVTVGALAGYATVGAIVGAAMGGLGAALAGGDMGDVLRGAAVGGISGALTGAMRVVGGTAGLNALNVAGHGVIGGASNVAMGGKFQDGFLSSATNAFAQQIPYANEGIPGLIKSGVVGGTSNALGGGKFSNGAYTAGFQYLVGDWGRNGKSSILGQTAFSPGYGLSDFLTEVSRPYFPVGGSANLAAYKKFGTLGITTGAAGAQAAANTYNYPFMDNPTSGPLIDIFQTAFQKLGLIIGVQGSLTQSIGQQLNAAGLSSGVEAYGHSQGTATIAGLFRFGYLSGGRMNLEGPAVDSITANLVAWKSSSGLRYYQKPGDAIGLANFPNIYNPIAPIMAPLDILMLGKIHTSYD